MRSLLFVPGDSEKKLEKGFQSGADVVIVDLEDSVAPASKVGGTRQSPPRFIQAVDTGTGHQDLCPRQRSRRPVSPTTTSPP